MTEFQLEVLVFDFTTVEDWNVLDKMFLAFEDFHDALLKDVSFFTAAYVDENRPSRWRTAPCADKWRRRRE